MGNRAALAGFLYFCAFEMGWLKRHEAVFERARVSARDE